MSKCGGFLRFPFELYHVPGSARWERRQAAAGERLQGVGRAARVPGAEGDQARDFSARNRISRISGYRRVVGFAATRRFFPFFLRFRP